MSIPSPGDEERTSTDQCGPGNANTGALPAYFAAVLQRDCEPEAGHAAATNTPSADEIAAPPPLTVTTSTTKTASGSSASNGAHQLPTSTDRTSVRSPGGCIDKKRVEQDHAQPQEGSGASTSMRATNGSDTGSDSDRVNRKKEQVECLWTINGVGSQFGDEDACKHAHRKPRKPEVVLHQEPKESEKLTQRFADIQKRSALIQKRSALMLSRIEGLEVKMAQTESRMKWNTRHQYLQTSLLVALVITGGIIAWKI